MLSRTMKLMFCALKLTTASLMLRREFIELTEEVMAAKYLMDSVREMVIKLLSRL